MRSIARIVSLALLVGFVAAAPADEPTVDEALAASIEELRSSVGRWSVETEFLNEDGSTARSVTGTYEFSWVVEDRVLAGKSVLPELGQASGILFYVNESERKIEMVSVGSDGRLWIMTGPLGGDTRTTREFPTAAGGNGRLRFTRFNVSSEAFESRMEFTEDGGKTWKPGNRQTFRRPAAASTAS